MKSLLLSICFAFVSSLTIAQTTQATEHPVVGKWKVITFDAGVHHDYKTGKTTFPDKLLKDLAGKKDSAMTVSLLQMIAGSYENYYFFFTSDGKYKEIRETKVKQEGTYKINTEKSLIETETMSKLGKPVKQEYSYKFKGTTLCFSVPQRDKPIELQVEKVIE